MRWSLVARAAAPFAFVALLLAMVLGSVAACGTSTGAGNRSPAPDFSGTTLDGQSVSLGGYRGKPLVLAFMATW
ncbi:MAG TPA: hypothetical protein VJP78_00505 [Thermoleophilia bacterium]|nr:hypothetical protein [Thermoleophilia bacterium]